jgi:hypothetical protein
VEVPPGVEVNVGNGVFVGVFTAGGVKVTAWVKVGVEFSVGVFKDVPVKVGMIVTDWVWVGVNVTDWDSVTVMKTVGVLVLVMFRQLSEMDATPVGFIFWQAMGHKTAAERRNIDRAFFIFMPPQA